MPTGPWLQFSLLACNSTRTVYSPPRLRSSENAAACVTLVTVKCTWLKSTLWFTVKVLTKFVTTAVEGTVSPVTLLPSSCPLEKMKLSTPERPLIANAITTRALGYSPGRFLSNPCVILVKTPPKLRPGHDHQRIGFAVGREVVVEGRETTGERLQKQSVRCLLVGMRVEAAKRDIAHTQAEALHKSLR